MAALLTAIQGECEVLRLGGDEFAILLTPAEDTDAVDSCQQILITAEMLLKPYGAGLSIGLASTEGADGLEGALIKADKALYQRKALGGGGVTLWQPAALASRRLIPTQPSADPQSARSEAPSR